jgi:hypothetical protein
MSLAVCEIAYTQEIPENLIKIENLVFLGVLPKTPKKLASICCP